MARGVADYLVSLHEGRIKAQGSVTETLKEDPKLFVEEKEDEGLSFSSFFFFSSCFFT